MHVMHVQIGIKWCFDPKCLKMAKNDKNGMDAMHGIFIKVLFIDRKVVLSQMAIHVVTRNFINLISDQHPPKNSKFRLR